MKIEELSLFEFTPVFDEKKAKWKPGVDGNKFCEVIAYIPELALCPLEQGYSGPGDTEKELRHNIWCDHALAIYNYLGVEAKWEQAIKLLKRHRITKEPIRLKIYQWRMKNFKDTQIVEYL